MPVMEFTCTHCNFLSGGLGLRGTKVYVLPNGLYVPMATTYSWCDECENLVEAEDLFEHPCLLSIEAAKVRMAALPKRPTRKWWQLLHFLFKSAWQMHVNEWERDQVGAQTDIDDNVDLLKIIRKRNHEHDSARCLKCGSRRILAADPAKHMQSPEYDEQYFIGLMHPGCGGQLQSGFNSEFRVAMRRSIVSYTPDGDFLTQEIIEGNPYDPDYSAYSFKFENARIRGY